MTQAHDSHDRRGPDDRKESPPLSSYSLAEYFDALTTGVMELDFGIVDPEVANHLVDIQNRGTRIDGLLPRSPLTSAQVRDLPAALSFSLNEHQFSGREQALLNFRREMGDALLYIQGMSPEHPERLFSRTGADLLPLYTGKLDQLGTGSYAAAAELADRLDDPRTSLWQRMSEEFPIWREVIRRVSKLFAGSGAD